MISGVCLTKMKPHLKPILKSDTMVCGAFIASNADLAGKSSVPYRQWTESIIRCCIRHICDLWGIGNRVESNLWNSLISNLPNPHFLQTYEWGQVKTKYGWSTLYAVWDAEGKWKV